MNKYTLIITEKPDAAWRIASALDLHGKAQRIVDHTVPYYVSWRDREIVVVPALGHLYTIIADGNGKGGYPVFSFKWVPRHVAEKDAKRIRIWLEVISKLAKDADQFVDACDYDVEGSVIGYNILRYACQNKEEAAGRMKYSTLTKEDLEKAYEGLLAHLDFTLIEAGLARHEVDWLYGINLTRALTITARKRSRRYMTLSTGRVQGPTLRFLVAREKAIKTFVPTPYWEIKAEIETCNQVIEFRYEKEKIETRKEADDIMRACRGRSGRIESIDTEQFQQPPPFPFDLGTLQSEAYRLFGYTPKRTASIAQQLYLEVLISYPRTSSQKLPRTIGYETVLKNLSEIPQHRVLATELLHNPRLRPNEGKKEDPAHPAIYPTGSLPREPLNDSERRIWDLVIRRFIAAFGEPALRQIMKARVSIGGFHFCAERRHTLKEGWTRFYAPYVESKDVSMPPMEEGQTASVKRINLKRRITRPPPRYNSGSILRKMEREEIGTKATRAETIQTLNDRKYAKGKTLTVTDLGFEVLEVLGEYCPEIVSVQMTRELEHKLDGIRRGNEKRKRIVAKTMETLKPILEKIKENEAAIGKRLGSIVERQATEERIIGRCPACKTGTLIVLHSRRSGKRFAGCTNYFRNLCKTSAPLPQHGIVKPLRKTCPACKWPLVQVRTKGKRAWTLCLNTKCPRKRRHRNEVHSM